MAARASRAESVETMMHGDVIVLLFLTFALICGVIVAILQTKMRDEQHTLLERKEQSDRVIRKLDAMLTAWAIHGDWNPACKAALLEAMKLGEPPAPRPVSAHTADLTMGMDVGVVLLLRRLWKGVR